MNKLTKEEIKEVNRYIKDICRARDELAFSLAEEIKDELLSVLQEKKKEWQELAVAEYRLKKEVVTKFYGSGLD